MSLRRGNQSVMDRSQSCVFLILFANQREGNPQRPGVHVNRKHHQVTKTPKKVSRNSGGCWKFTSPAFLWGSVGSKGAGEDNQTNSTQKPLGHGKGHSAMKAGRKVSSMSVNLRVIRQAALFFSEPWLTRDFFVPMLTAELPTVGVCTIWSHCECTVAVHQWCVLFPAAGLTSLTGCRRGWVEGGNSTPTCCLWPHYNCRPIWGPEPTRVNLSPIGASGTASRQWKLSASRLHLRHNSCWPRVSTTSSCMRTPGEVGQGESHPVVPCCFLVCFFWPKWQTQFCLSALSLNSGRGNGYNEVKAVVSSIPLWLSECVFVQSRGDSFLFLHLCCLILGQYLL